MEQWRELVIERQGDGTITGWSAGCAALYGWTAEQALGAQAHRLLQTVFPAGGSFAAVQAQLAAQGHWQGRLRQTSRSGATLVMDCRMLLRPAREDAPDAGAQAVVEQLRDASAERRAQTALHGSEARLRSIFETAADAIIVADGRGAIVSVNRAALSMFGCADAAELVGANLAMLMPSSEGVRHDGYLRAYRGNRGEASRSHAIGVAGRALMARRRDGSEFPIELSVGSFESDGMVFFTGIVRDISERRRAEELRHLLLREVDHRAKNALAVALSLLRLTPRHDPAGFAASVEGRVAAMARAHSLLAQQEWDGADLHTLLHGELVAYWDQVALQGPVVRIAANAVQPAAMVIHELTVNAAKYGAFSQPGGSLAVDWAIDPASAALQIRWKERGVCILQPPAGSGFGSRLLRSLVQRQLQGQFDLAWQADGLLCRMSMQAQCAAAGGPEGSADEAHRIVC